MSLCPDKELIIVKNDLLLNMTPEYSSKTFQIWPKAKLFTEETIESKGYIQREKNDRKLQNQNMFTTVGYCEKSELSITQLSALNWVSNVYLIHDTRTNTINRIWMTFQVRNPVSYENRQNLYNINVLCREGITQYVSNWPLILCNQTRTPAIKFLEKFSQSQHPSRWFWTHR